MPCLALFFPVAMAVAATAIVHLFNSLLKATLLLRHADYKVVVRFCLPAIPLAMLGALLLDRLSSLPMLARIIHEPHSVVVLG